MRLPMLSIALVATALAAEMAPPAARSPTSYPWCARIPQDRRRRYGLLLCELQAVHDDAVGRGGYCYHSPDHHAAAAKARPRVLR
jgi:hypothetical protein